MQNLKKGLKSKFQGINQIVRYSLDYWDRNGVSNLLVSLPPGHIIGEMEILWESLQCKALFGSQLAYVVIVANYGHVVATGAHIGGQCGAHPFHILSDIDATPLVNRVRIVHGLVQDRVVLMAVRVVVIVVNLGGEIDNVAYSLGQRQLLRKRETVHGRTCSVLLVPECNDVDPLTILRKVAVIAGVQNLFLHSVIQRAEGAFDDIVCVAAVMVHQILHILTEDGFGLAFFDHPVDLRIENSALVFEAFAVACYRERLAGEPCCKNIDLVALLQMLIVHIALMEIWGPVEIGAIGSAGVLVDLVSISYLAAGLDKALADPSDSGEQASYARLRHRTSVTYTAAI